ncbi:polysaccharide deacetylase family protein [Brevibacterium permense]|uniref:polysaccharide deacetylase family protein n=1 Tax=Brevibacterium permense TaxID=234834 RepID=UPI0021D3A84D|nr:polysaccharide deacetylase family protein [Brevibacterium permense]
MSVGTGVMQRYTTVNATPQVWMRRGQTDGSNWFPWVRLDAGGIELDGSGGGGLGHELLRQGIQARKGGRIGTDGRGVIALRFDDAPAEFVAKVLPLLEERGLPFTRVTTSESVNGVDLPVGTFADMQDYSIQFGGEVWNHGRTHGESTGAELDGEISGALDTLRAAMPRLPIDCFAPPGGSITWGGYMPSTSIESYTTTVAGQMVMNLHGFVTGYYTDSYYWPLDGNMRDGQNHYSCDVYNANTMKTLVNRARDWRVGIVMMWHAHNLDTDGNTTTADLAEALDYLAAERDAGNLLVLTVSGMATADSSSSYRRDPLTTHSGSAWSETFQYPQFRREIPGSTRELTATVTGTAGATVTSKIGESTRTHAIPAGGSLKLRHLATIPKDVTALSVSITGGTTANAHLYAV